MSIATEVKPATEQVVLAAPAAPVEEVKEVSAPVAPITEIAPLTEDKQSTTTHAEAGTLHTPAEAATTVDGTPAEVPAATETPAVAFAEPTTETKEEKKEAKKEKVEKVKSEGKGFFAKLFGNISPKKEKKVKTPKTEQADPTPVTDAPVAESPAADAPAAEVATETEPKAEITGVALAAEPAQAPAVIEAPAASTSAVETEAVKETETTAEPVAAPIEPVVESKPAETTAEKDAKAAKAHRRISVRLTSFVKNIGKKDAHPAKPEHKDIAAETTATETTPVVSDEAPKIAEPAPSEPISIENNEKAPAPTTHAVAPPAAPVVAAAA